MNLRTALAGLIAMFALHGSAVPAAAEAIPAYAGEFGTFAVVDGTGSKLRPNATLSDPQMLTTALCPGGQRLDAVFDRNGFVVSSAHLAPGTICFLAAARLMDGAAPFALTASGSDVSCGRTRVMTYEKLKDRPVAGCWVLARDGSSLKVAALEFARRLRYALASVVVDAGERTLFADFHGDFWAPGWDVWHAGDGGELRPADISIIAAFTRGDTCFLALSWAASDGISLSFWQSAAGDELVQVVDDFWVSSQLQ